MIEGIGIDLVEISRLKESLERTSGMRERLFTERERELKIESLAGRFAAKEALYKALHRDSKMRHAHSFQEAEIINEENGRPAFIFYGALATELADARVHLSISHDSGNAMAFVIIER